MDAVSNTVLFTHKKTYIKTATTKKSHQEKDTAEEGTIL